MFRHPFPYVYFGDCPPCFALQACFRSKRRTPSTPKPFLATPFPPRTSNADSGICVVGAYMNKRFLENADPKIVTGQVLQFGSLVVSERKSSALLAKLIKFLSTRSRAQASTGALHRLLLQFSMIKRLELLVTRGEPAVPVAAWEWLC